MTADQPVPGCSELSTRGYPLPPWSYGLRRPSATELVVWLGDLTEAQRLAYLDVWLERHGAAQARASACVIEAHEERLEEAATERHDFDQVLANANRRANDFERSLRTAIDPDVLQEWLTAQGHGWGRCQPITGEVDGAAPTTH